MGQYQLADLRRLPALAHLIKRTHDPESIAIFPEVWPDS